MSPKIILAIIFIVGFILRFYGLSSNPPSLNWDEVSHGYNSYSILKTGSDEWGQKFPVSNFRAYGDYPLPLNLYLTIPWIYILGLNEFSIRIPSALFGSLLILVIYFLTVEISSKKKLGLIAAFLVAVSPWTLMMSRQVLQATPAIFFLSLGIWLFIRGVKNNSYLSVLGVIGLGLSAYTYHNTRILAPIIFISLLIFYWKELLKIKKPFILLLLTAGVFFLPLFPILLSSEGSARAAWVGILNPGAISEINESRGQSILPDPFPKLIHNKLTFFASETMNHYIGYFNPKFLFFEGGTHYQFSIPGLGIIYPISLPFFYLGLVLLILKFKTLSRELKFILVLTLLMPIPASITRDENQVIRASTMIIPIFIIISLGLNNFLDILAEKRIEVKRIFLVIFVFLNLLFLTNFIYQFWVNYPRQYSFAWQYGYKQVAQFIMENQQDYEEIYITKKYGEPHEFLLFFLKVDPQGYKSDPNLIRYGRSDWFWVDRFSKYYFLNDWEVEEKVKDKQNSLLVTSPGNYPPSSIKLQTITFLDGTPAFDIVKL